MTLSDDICRASAVELLSRFRAKALSPVEVAEELLDRIEAFEPGVNAFACLTPELALEAAKRAEDAWLRGDSGPLLGVPVTIKDLFHLEGFPTEQGSRSQVGRVADADCPVAARLKAAGAVVLGKTTTSEFGWTGVSRSPLTGVTHNPWRHGYNAGASSAGAGAAAAARFGPLHQGSDGAGSIRMPCHFSGVVGLKPTWGTVPHVPLRNNDQVSHVGPMARSVADLALFLNATAGPHPFDHTSMVRPADDFGAELERDVSGLRIAFSPDLGHARVDAEVADVVRAAVRLFETAGCNVEEVAPEWGPEGAELARFFWVRGQNLLGGPSRRVGEADGSGPGGVHPGWQRAFGRNLPRHAGAQVELRRTPAPLHGGLGSAAHAFGLRGRLPRPTGCNPSTGRSTRGTGSRGRSSPIPST